MHTMSYERERQVIELKKYGLSTALVSFLLSAFAFGCLLYAEMRYEEVPIVERVIKNWHDQPILNITTVDTNRICPSGFEPMLTTEWPGTQDYCLCYPDQSSKKATPGRCSLKEENNCQSFEGVKPIQMQILKEKRYCIQRSDYEMDYSDLPPIDLVTGNCPDKYKLCGQGTTTCYPEEKICPINEIKLIPKNSGRNLQTTEDTESHETSSQTKDTDSSSSGSTEESSHSSSQEENEEDTQEEQGHDETSSEEKEHQESQQHQGSHEQSEEEEDSEGHQEDSETQEQDKEKEQQTQQTHKQTQQKQETKEDNKKKISVRFPFDEVYDFYASNDGYGNPVVEFSWGYYYMCLKNEYYSVESPDHNASKTGATLRRNDLSPFLNMEKLGCPRIDKHLGSFDSRWESLVSYTESGVYSQNGIYNAVDSIPHYTGSTQGSTDIEQIPKHTVYYRRYVTWKPECANEPLRHPHRLRDQNKSMKEIHQQLLILTLLCLVVFTIVGIIYPSLTCCCQCCGASTLTSYRLFLASKGVATFLLVGGFSVMMSVFIQKPYSFNSNFAKADCSDELTNKMIWESDRSVDRAFAFESLSFISLGVLLVVEIVMASYYCCIKDYSKLE